MRDPLVRVCVRALVMVLVFSGIGYTAPTVVDFWSSGGPQVKAGLDRIIERFEAQHPDIKVQLTMFSTWQDMHRRILLSLAGGDPPDAARMKPLTAGDYASKGAIEPLSPYLERDGIDVSQFADPLIEKSSMYLGTLYVLPMSASLPILYYNVDHFIAAGLDVDQPPETWNDIIQYGKKIQATGKAQWGYMPQGGALGFLMHLWQNGGAYLSNDLTAPLFNSREGVEALEWQLDLMYTRKITPTPNFWDEQEILNGQVGIWERALSGLSFFRVNAPNLNWRTARLARNVRQTSMEMSEGSIIFSASKNKDAAWEWIKFLSMDPEAGIIFYQEYGQLPTTKSVLMSEYFQSDPLIAPAIWHLLNDLEARPIMPQAQELIDILDEEHQLALYRRKSPADALASAEARFREIIAKIEWN